MIDLEALKEELDNDREPCADIGICMECGWRGPLSDCETDVDGDWESGYYQIHLCPQCEDGGCIDYDMTEATAVAWEEWHKKVTKQER